MDVNEELNCENAKKSGWGGVGVGRGRGLVGDLLIISYHLSHELTKANKLLA